LRIVVAPRRRASPSAAATQSSGISHEATTTSAQSKSAARAGRDADLVAPRAIHQDEGGAGPRLGAGHDARHTDAFRVQRRADLAAGGVVADAADQPHLGPEPARRHRLVGALAAARDQQRALGDGLAGLGQAFECDREVDVGGADD